MTNISGRDHTEEPEIILGNSSSRFSGVTSTMLQVLDVQKRRINLAVLGHHYLPESIQAISFWRLAKLCQHAPPEGRCRVFHARRNDEMIQAVLLKYVFRAKIKIVFTSTAQRRKSWITHWLMRQMDGLLSTCSAAASYMTIPPDRIIPHGVDPNLYHPAADRDQLWSELELPGRYGIGIFGRVRHQKGVDTLVEAAISLLPRYPDFTIVVVGEITTDQREFLKIQQEKLRVAGLEERVVFTGILPFAEIPTYMRAMSIITALSRNEGFGLTVLEAMSSCTAVIATQAGAWPDIINDGTDGYLIPVGDVPALNDRLRQLMDNVVLREHMGMQARRKVLRQYTVEREALALIDFYRSV